MNGMVDPTLTKADAHRVFGDLYRKPRSPELQAEVDKIVASTSDVFVRIERIEQLDAKQKPSGFSDEDLAGDPRRQQRRRSGAAGKSGGKANRTGSSGKKKSASGGDDSVGWFERLFGSAISRWGKKTGTLESGLFSKPRLAESVYGIFRGLREDQLTASVKALRALAGGAWEVLEPARYNTMIAAYQFLTEFARTESTLRKSERPEDWITGTIKMQKFYALLEQYPDWQKIITGDIIELTRKTENIAPLADTLAATMKYIATLNSRKPTFKNAIIAMYTLARDRVCDWDDVLKELKIRKPALDTYRAPDQVTTRIHQRITDLRNKYSNIKAQLDDINRIKENYYQLDSDGRLKTDFLNPIVREAIRRTFGDTSVSDSSVAAYKREAHRLLYAVLKDFDANALNVLNGAVNTMGDGHHSEEIFVFKQGLLKKHIEQFDLVFRESESFLKKYKDMSYGFTDFMSDLKKPPQDPVVQNFIGLVKRANKVFKAFNYDLSTVAANHEKALERDRLGKMTDGLRNTAVLPIENFEPGPRFIPFAHRKVVGNTRYNDMTVGEVVEDMLRNLYNFLYIFRDQELTAELTSIPEKTRSLDAYKEQLARLGVNVEASPG